MNESLNKAFAERTLLEDKAAQERIAKIVHLLAKDEVTFFEASNELNKVKELLQYCKIKSSEITKIIKKTASHEKRQSIVEKAKSIAFESCDEHIHKLCDEIIELARD